MAAACLHGFDVIGSQSGAASEFRPERIYGWASIHLDAFSGTSQQKTNGGHTPAVFPSLGRTPFR
jgi:hypothetical protein